VASKLSWLIATEKERIAHALRIPLVACFQERDMWCTTNDLDLQGPLKQAISDIVSVFGVTAPANLIQDYFCKMYR